MTNHEGYQSPKNESKFFYGYIVVIAALCIMVTVYGTRATFGVFFTPMVTEFGWSRALISGAFSLCMLMQGLATILMGGLNDRLGPRIVLTLCGFLLGLGFLLMSQVSTAWQLYLFYVVIIGIGMSGVLVPCVNCCEVVYREAKYDDGYYHRRRRHRHINFTTSG